MSKVITDKDRLIEELLQDGRYKVKRDGRIFRKHKDGWRLAGGVSKSRGGTKNYMRIRYRGIRLYVHRIVYAAFNGPLKPDFTINHRDLNGLNNHIDNLELVSPSANMIHAKSAYRAMGMTAAQAKANWAARSKNKNGAMNRFNWRGSNDGKNKY